MSDKDEGSASASCDMDQEIILLLEATEKLMHELAELGRHFRKAQHADERREHVRWALGALILHLDNVLDAPRDAVAMLEALLGDIQAIHEGRQVVFLERTPDPHAPRRSPLDDAVLVHASAGIDLLVGAGASLDEAARRVMRLLQAEKLQPFSNDPHSDTPGHTSLVNFRKKLRSKNGRPDLKKHYQDTKQIGSEQIASGMPVEDTVKLLLDHVAPHGSKVS